MTLQIHRPGQKILTVPPGFGVEFFAPKAAAEYADKVLATQSANLIAYWPLWEPSGSVADNYEGTAARDGAYTGVTLGETGIGDGRTCPLFDGANDLCNIYTTSFRDAFNGSEGALALWARVYNAAVWTDSSTRFLVRLYVNASNSIYIAIPMTSNQIDYRYEAGNTVEFMAKTGISETGWMHIALTWSATADEVKMYCAGAQEGVTQAGLGSWSGSLASTQTMIGAKNTTPANVMHGYVAHVAVWTTPLTPAEMATLAVV